MKLAAGKIIQSAVIEHDPNGVHYVTYFMTSRPLFFPESRQAFTLAELKEIVKEMEKMNDLRPE